MTTKTLAFLVRTVFIVGYNKYLSLEINVSKYYTTSPSFSCHKMSFKVLPT